MNDERLKVAVVGASGYGGGELLALLLNHPKVEVNIAVSRKLAGEYVFRTHPNLRGRTSLKFSPLDMDMITKESDLVFFSTPHGVSKNLVPKVLEVGTKVIDLSPDFRLRNAEDYPKWYGWEHPYPDILRKAAYGIPELHRDEIRNASLVACPGCIALSGILALVPVAKAHMVEKDKIILDSKIGSSGSGEKPSLSTHHPERSGVIRPYMPSGHRHTAEIEQELNLFGGDGHKVGLSAHAVDIVRGILSTAHVFPNEPVEMKSLWKAYRDVYGNEPFIRLVRDQKGIYRLADPKVVVGTNFCDISFEIDSHLDRIVLFSAIDNLVKGAAGSAVQSMDIIHGWEETLGLEFLGFHPV